jgi:alpha-ketoglutarate-dependent taurine dioxygenase
MMPVNDDAKEVAQAMKAHFEPTYSIDWGVCSMVVFDNWRFFHMRGKSPEDDRGWLWRIAVWSSK